MNLKGLGPQSPEWAGQSFTLSREPRGGPEQSRTAEWAATSQPAALQGILTGISGLETLVTQSPHVY